MPRTEQEQKDFELQCYGCTEQDMENELNEMFGKRDPSFYAVCILSDVQELMAQASEDHWVAKRALEKARKLVNKAKWFARYEGKKEAI